MVQAGSMGVPYVPVRGFAGSDIVARRTDTFMTVPNPFEPEESFVVAKAITPDVGIFHGLKADRLGNVLVRKNGEELMLAQSSRRVIVTVEEIVDDLDPNDSAGWFIPAIHVTAVVHAPQGAYPTAAPGYYPADHDQLKEYVEAAQSDDTFSAYMDKYVKSVNSHDEYLERVGLAPARELVTS